MFELRSDALAEAMKLARDSKQIYVMWVDQTRQWTVVSYENRMSANGLDVQDIRFILPDGEVLRYS